MPTVFLGWQPIDTASGATNVHTAAIEPATVQDVHARRFIWVNSWATNAMTVHLLRPRAARNRIREVKMSCAVSV